MPDLTLPDLTLPDLSPGTRGAPASATRRTGALVFLRQRVCVPSSRPTVVAIEAARDKDGSVVVFPALPVQA
ncbi:hypothetical protein GCM10010503_25430 [Streptomyces lucensis JCM 4490]|uniref:Uncharacterized protein n=1 Tax=Streptomyces lucensis JCM 4490 TaxID=1306176 RepID=A0A918J4S3_9ACTN|nr:hypothetical protein GCM10010503_25430 [Streptomyces lucensis JCM 4490]